jgi:hypothetical protein
MSALALFHVVWPYALQLGAAAFAVWFGKHVKNGADAQRALALAQIAKDVARAVLAKNPNLPWLSLVKDVVDTLATVAGVTNTAALERAAISALTELGAKKQ